jgi:hypothetical protein
MGRPIFLLKSDSKYGFANQISPFCRLRNLPARQPFSTLQIDFFTPQGSIADVTGGHLGQQSAPNLADLIPAT